MRRNTSGVAASLQAQVLGARGAGLRGSLHLYLLLFLLGMFALTAFQSTPHHMAGSSGSSSDTAGGRQRTTSLRGTATAKHAAAAQAAAAQAQAVAAAGAAAAAAAEPAACHEEAGAEYDGEDVVVWGSEHLKASAAACCAACQAAAAKGCNVWVWCGSAAGCEGGRAHHECWLKHKQDMRLGAPIPGRRGTAFTSGALFSTAERDAAVAAETARLAALKADEDLPLVWLDVAIQGKPVGRIHFVLLTKDSPRAAENFRQLCTGEKGIVPPGREGAGKPYSLKGRPWYRIIDGFIDQAGAETESVFGGQFKDDEGGLKLKHDRKGLLSMANTGPNTNTAHFSIMVDAAPHLNGHYTIFGEAVDGFEVIDAINALARGKKDNTATAAEGAVIADAGQIRKGRHVPNLEL